MRMIEKRRDTRNEIPKQNTVYETPAIAGVISPSEKNVMPEDIKLHV